MTVQPNNTALYTGRAQRRRTCVPSPSPIRITLSHRAFSLVEIMVVLVIIGILAGVVTVNVRGYLIRGRQDAARAQIAAFVSALETWQSIHHRFPTNDEGLEILTVKSDRMPEPAIIKIPKDPWDRVYQYNHPGRNGPYEVITFGADGREGGTGGDMDISSEALQSN